MCVEGVGGKARECKGCEGYKDCVCVCAGVCVRERERERERERTLPCTIDSFTVCHEM